MRRNNKALYELIMRNVSKQVKKALNEDSNDIDTIGIFSFIPDAMAFNENSFVNRVDQEQKGAEILTNFSFSFMIEQLDKDDATIGKQFKNAIKQGIPTAAVYEYANNNFDENDLEKITSFDEYDLDYSLEDHNDYQNKVVPVILLLVNETGLTKETIAEAISYIMINEMRYPADADEFKEIGVNKKNYTILYKYVLSVNPDEESWNHETYSDMMLDYVTDEDFLEEHNGEYMKYINSDANKQINDCIEYVKHNYNVDVTTDFVKSCLSELNEYANEDHEYLDY